ncbi:hypothetical protein H2248_008569 [Termitomyces sp. 'cryptogamus']|nr:hypothetical protein H2248_008569 [Termitomyces sp. 'cryptogamus']
MNHDTEVIADLQAQVEIPRLQFSTPQPSSPASPVFARSIQSSPLKQRSTQTSSLNLDPPTPAATHVSAVHDYLQSHYAPSHSASLAPSRKSTAEFPDDVYSILSNLTGAINSLREE